jgi:YegS/Rv2252/BmrU family lipid kinase
VNWIGVLNPGARDASKAGARAAAALREAGVAADVRVSESPAHLRELVTGAAAAGADGVIAIGGDGTVSMVADALLSGRPAEPPLLGILPAGSGCDFIRTFGIPQDLERAARHLAGDRTYLSDAAVVEGSFGRRHFVNAADLGVLGAAVKRAERLTRRLGTARYLAAFWLVLPTFRRSPVRIVTERRTVEAEALAVVLANGQFFGTNLNIAPKATLVDGVLDVQVFSCSRLQAVPIVRKARRGLHLGHPSVTRFSAAEIEITTGRPWPIEVDGDYLGETPVRVRVLPGALRIKI